MIDRNFFPEQRDLGNLTGPDLVGTWLLRFLCLLSMSFLYRLVGVFFYFQHWCTVEVGEKYAPIAAISQGGSLRYRKSVYLLQWCDR